MNERSWKSRIDMYTTTFDDHIVDLWHKDQVRDVTYDRWTILFNMTKKCIREREHLQKANTKLRRLNEKLTVKINEQNAELYNLRREK